jgi:hypothetical protein
VSSSASRTSSAGARRWTDSPTADAVLRCMSHSGMLCLRSNPATTTGGRSRSPQLPEADRAYQAQPHRVAESRPVAKRVLHDRSPRATVPTTAGPRARRSSSGSRAACTPQVQPRLGARWNRQCPQLASTSRCSRSGVPSSSTPSSWTSASPRSKTTTSKNESRALTRNSADQSFRSHSSLLWRTGVHRSHYRRLLGRVLTGSDLSLHKLSSFSPAVTDTVQARCAPL